MRAIDHIAGIIENKKTDWSSARDGKKQDWERYYRVWRCVESEEDKSRESERSTVKMPGSKVAIDTAYDNIYSMVFGRDPFFEIKGRQLEDEIKAELISQYISYLMEKQKFPAEFGLFIKEMLIYGTGLGEVEVETAIEKRIALDEFGNQIVEEKSINRPRFKHISIFDFFIDPSAKDIPSASGLCVRSFKRVPELKKLQRQGVISGVNFLEESLKPKDVDEDLRYRLQESGVTIPTGAEDGRIEVLRYWGWMDEVDLRIAGFQGEIEDGGAEIYAIVANGVTLKLSMNPFYTQERPFVKDCYEEVPSEFYGLGICEITDGPQRALDATVRARIDNKALSIAQMFGIDVTRMVEGQDMTVYPGKVWLSEGDINQAIKQFTVQDVTSGTYIDAQEYERYIQEGSKISKMLGGQPVKRGEMSATESSAITQQQSVGIRATVRSLEDNALKEILRWYYQISLQFLDVPETLKVQTEEGGQLLLTITADDIIGDYDFIPQGTSAIAMKDELNKTLQFMQLTTNPVDVQMTDRAYLITKVYKMLGFNDIEKALSGIKQEEAITNAQGMKGAGSQTKASEPGMPNV